MKRRVPVSVIFLLCGTLLFSQAIDKPLATVRLTTTQAITQKQLKRIVDALESQLRTTLTMEQRMDRLNELTVTDNELNSQLTTIKKTYGMQLAGRDLTDAELQQLVKQQGLVWDDFVKDQKYVILATKYARFKNQAAFSAITQPTDDEARVYYDANKTKQFVTSDMAHIKWIVVDTRALTTKDERDKAAKRADDILKELKGGAKFEDLVVKYSDDTTTKYKGGDLGWVYRTNAQTQQYLGDAFMNTIFSMKKGDMSGVITTNQAFVIVQVIDKFDAKILDFDEQIPPLNQSTVKDAIKGFLYQQKASETLATVVTDIAKNLRKDAEVKIYEENLVW
jgi:parvulin-like peptidyl-prolyl isomerase